MSKEKSCKCCKQIWYVDMLDKKWKLCPNCYGYCKPLIDDLKIKDRQITDLQQRLEVTEKALELACKEIDSEYMYGVYCTEYPQYFKEQAEKEIEGENNENL